MKIVKLPVKYIRFLTVYATDRGFVEYRNELRRRQHQEGRYKKYEHKK